MNVWNITPDQRQHAIEQLLEGDCSCVILRNGELYTFHQRGIDDLYQLLTENQKFLSGTFVADKVVGKGAAALMILGGVEEVYAHVASTAALKLFRVAGVKVETKQEVPHIINHAQTGICPVETRCADCRTAEECLSQIEAFLHERRAENRQLTNVIVQIR